jgi:hypothetical protein
MCAAACLYPASSALPGTVSHIYLVSGRTASYGLFERPTASAGRCASGLLLSLANRHARRCPRAATLHQTATQWSAVLVLLCATVSVLLTILGREHQQLGPATKQLAQLAQTCHRLDHSRCGALPVQGLCERSRLVLSG